MEAAFDVNLREILAFIFVEGSWWLI